MRGKGVGARQTNAPTNRKRWPRPWTASYPVTPPRTLSTRTIKPRDVQTVAAGHFPKSLSLSDWLGAVVRSLTAVRDAYLRRGLNIYGGLALALCCYALE
jgi:hypothetical protein